MITQKRIIIVLTFLVILVGLFLLWLSLEETETTKQKENIAAPFQIEGLDRSEYELPADTRRTITETIRGYLVDAKIKTTNVRGEVRTDSFRRETINDGVRTLLLIDIPSVKRTYKASISNDSDGYAGIYVVCPTESELIYDEFECRDETQS